MRTASEIIRDTFDSGTGDELIADLYIKAVNEARIEALIEAAGKTNYPYRDEYGCVCDVPSIVLQLIDEVK